MLGAESRAAVQPKTSFNGLLEQPPRGTVETHVGKSMRSSGCDLGHENPAGRVRSFFNSGDIAVAENLVPRVLARNPSGGLSAEH